MTAPDQTNAEVSDERLREIEGWAKLVSTFPQAEGHPPPERYADIAAVCTELIARRSVTSQASEGAADALPVDCPYCNGTGIEADYVGLNMTPVASTCSHCNGEGIDPDVPAASPSKRVERLETATHRHVKRGSEYVLIGYGKMQSNEWSQPTVDGFRRVSVDMAEVAIYRSVDDGSLWVRPREEFEDGRFQTLQGGRS